MASDAERTLASILFAKELKKYGDVTYEPKIRQGGLGKEKATATVNAVVAFDAKLFHKKCHPASDAYDATIQLDIVAQRRHYNNGD